jgi:hypothetical protein
MLDSERIAWETLAHSLLPKAFIRAGADQGPDELHRLLSLWHTRRRSILTSRQDLVGEAESLLCELPLELREQLPDSTLVRPRLAALQRRDRRRRYDPPTRLRWRLLDGYDQQIQALDREEKQVGAALDALVDQSGSTLGELCGRCTRSVAELLVETGDPRRFNATARCPPRPRKAPASRCATATSPAGTGASTRCFTGWPSPSRAASRAPRRSTPTPAPTGIPRRRPAASSSDTAGRRSQGAAPHRTNDPDGAVGGRHPHDQQAGRTGPHTTTNPVAACSRMPADGLTERRSATSPLHTAASQPPAPSHESRVTTWGALRMGAQNGAWCVRPAGRR